MVSDHVGFRADGYCGDLTFPRLSRGIPRGGRGVRSVVLGLTTKPLQLMNSPHEGLVPVSTGTGALRRFLRDFVSADSLEEANVTSVSPAGIAASGAVAAAVRVTPG